MRARTAAVMALATMFVAGVSPVQAVIVTMAMEGNVETLVNPLGFLDFAHVGDRVVYTFAFDSNAPDTNPTMMARYDALWASARVGQTDVSIGSPYIVIQKAYSFSVSGSVALGDRAGFLCDLADDDHSAFPDVSLPLVPYDLSLFDIHEFQLYVFGPPIPPDTYPSFSRLIGTIDSFYLVPEPGALCLAGLGAALIRMRRKEAFLRKS